MPKLNLRDDFYLLATQGWLELGDWRSANDELDNISPELRAHPLVLLLRGQAFFAGKEWDGLLAISETLVKIAPKKSQGWIHRSYALYATGRVQEAFDSLLPVAETFPEQWLISYHLACYTAQLGRMEDAEGWFKKAMAIDEHTVKSKAIDDPDLEPLWRGMLGSTWARIK